MTKNFKFEITRAAIDQNKNRWAQISKGKSNAWVSLSLYAESDIYGTKQFNKIGVALLTTKAKNEAKEALQEKEPNEEIHVALKPGYIKSKIPLNHQVIGYAHAYGELFLSRHKDVPEVIIGFEPHADFGKGGDPQAFQVGMGPLVKDQALPVLMLTLGLSPILQPFVPRSHYVENMVTDLCGKGSNLKSAIAVSIAGAQWGCSERKTGFFQTGNATANKIEKTLPMYNNALAGRDETTAIADDAHQRGKALGNLVHRISGGTIKDRMNDDDSAIVELQAIFTSNQGLRSMSSEDPDVLEALETRIITINIPLRPTGAYDFLPEGYPTTTSVQQQLYTLGFAHYGHIARDMIQKTLIALDKDSLALRQKILQLMEKFMGSVAQGKLNDRQIRSLKLFALCYACGVLAKNWGVLDKELFGSFKEPLQRAWAMAQGGTIVDIREPFIAYLRLNAAKIQVIDNQDRPELTDEEFAKAKAFIIELRDGKLLACFPARRMPTRFPGFETPWKKLRSMGQIVADSGLQSGQRIRLKDGEVFKDKVYALRIESWPLA